MAEFLDWYFRGMLALCAAAVLWMLYDCARAILREVPAKKRRGR